MRYTVDFEFDGHGGPVISMALVPESMESEEDALYMIVQYHSEASNVEDQWVRENVIPILYSCPADAGYCPQYRLGAHLRSWLKDDPHPIIIADSPVDIWRFCELISSSEFYEWESTNIPKLSFEVHNVDCWPNNLGPEAVQHNAYWDAVAMWEKLRGG